MSLPLRSRSRRVRVTAAVPVVLLAAALAAPVSPSRGAGANTAQIVGTEARIEIDRVWYTPTSFRVVSPDGDVLEEFTTEIEGRGMQFQAEAAERFVAAGVTSSDVLPIDETVAIMG
ncbi:oxidoreductase, partial [Microbacterium testaceum]